MTPAFPAKNVVNLALIALLVWLHFGSGGILPVAAGPIRVLVVYDGVEQPINSTAVLHYLHTHCVKDGDAPAFRQWPSGVDATNESPEFKKLLALPRKSSPWVFIQSQSGHVLSGPLPAAIDEQLALFTKWGGP
jgi:hypothetical protein